MADHILLTKSDLPEARSADLQQRVTALNPTATMQTAFFGAVDPAVLFESQPQSSVKRLVKIGAHPAGEPRREHDAGIASACFVREQPVRAVALAMFLEALAEHCGAGLLRVKGIVNVKENLNHPAVIHGVQHVFHQPAWMEKWPSDDRRTRMVLIGHELPPLSWVRNLLEILDAEVADETARLSGTA